MIKKAIKTIRKMKKRILAIPAAAAEIPVNPKSAAMIATIKKIIAHLSMMRLLKIKVTFCPCELAVGQQGIRDICVWGAGSWILIVSALHAGSPFFSFLSSKPMGCWAGPGVIPGPSIHASSEGPIFQRSVIH